MAEERDENTLAYSPPGYVAACFHNQFAFVRGLMGPVGSGKSSSCCMEIFLHTMRQQAFRGVRRARWAVIRNTYPELKTTTIKTWQAWFPEQIAPMKWDQPITSRLKLAIPDGTSIDLEVIFLALDRPEEVGKLKSLELTGVWINEASEIPKEIFDKATERVGRYPSKKDGGVGCVDPCVILDTNPMDDDHWYYRLAEEETPKGWKFFKQPGGMMPVLDAEGKPALNHLGRMTFVPNPDAENIFNLPGKPYGYYEQMLGGKTDEYILMFVCGQYGRVQKGKAVYPTFNDRVHVLEEDREAIPGLPIYCGWDFGLTPAFVVVQPTPLGELLVLDELVAEDVDVREFADSVVKPFLATKYSSFRRISVGDPAGVVRSQIDLKRTPFTEVNEAGIPTEPANTNELVPRIAAVSYFLSRMSGGKPAFKLNKRCKVLRKGFNGGYMLQRLNVSGSAEPVFKERPAKNKFSHPHDALQYACLAIRGGADTPVARTVKKTGRGR